MTATKPMTALRRRPMPGMPAAPEPPQEVQLEPSRPEIPATPPPATPRPAAGSRSASHGRRQATPTRRAAQDYSATRLTNFRLPVDLHDRYRGLIHQAQHDHPRLRRLSLTEVLIALMEEGPQTPDEVAELVRRKRADEHREETDR